MPKCAPVDESSHVVLVDGSTYIFRAYHALPPLTRKSDGLPIGAVSGFCNMLFKLLRDKSDIDEPTHFAVVFDKGSKTFRNEFYPEYKAHRPPPPEDLKPQFPLTREATEAFGVPSIEMENYEADDLIATYATQAEAKGAKVTIISSDKDLMQLVSDHVSMFDTMKNQAISYAEVEKKFGVAPDKVVEVQALAGDSVDNVPGVPGIGVKTAVQLLEEYGDLESLLTRAGEIKQPKRRENLINHAEDARVSLRLVTLDREVPVEVPLEDLCVDDPDTEVLLDFMEKMEFRTLTNRVRAALGDNGSIRTEDESIDATPEVSLQFDREKYECVTDEARLLHWIKRAEEEGIVAVDLETNGLDSAACDMVGICLAVGENEAAYVPVAHVGEGDLLGDSAPEQISRQKALALLKPMLENPAILKVGQNFKFDLAVFYRYDVAPAPYDDTMLISYVLEGGLHGHGMDELSEMFLGHTPIPFKEIAGTGKNQKTFDQLPLDKATDYAAEDADVTLRLWRLLKPRLAKEGMATVYETLERGMPEVLARMELEGIKVDPAALSRLSATFTQKMAQLEDEAHEQAGEKFNLGSPSQLGEILFGKMELPGGKKTKTGKWSTSVSVLEELAAEGHELPVTLMEWRKYQKLTSTYTEALKSAINPDTKRVHTSFALAATTTGRLSSSDPNLQNIPVRTEDGRKIREAFVPEAGNKLVAADYSQIELRILAHVADLPQMKQAFADGIDIHALTASEMFGVPVKDMDPQTRRKAKAINFGIIYGISAFGLANNLGIGRSEAKDYIDAYFEKFPGIKDYMEDTKAFAREHGYVETVFGRRCHVKGIKDNNPNMRAFAERQAINAPIQGSAADVIRRAMMRMPAALCNAGLDSRMLLQVHDELVFEAPEGEVDKLTELAKSVMSKASEPAVSISVPLVVDVGVGDNWNEAH